MTEAELERATHWLRLRRFLGARDQE